MSVNPSTKSSLNWFDGETWIMQWLNFRVCLSRDEKKIEKVPECKALKKLGYLWSSFGQGLTIKELCILLPTTISQYSSICYASTYPRILSHLLFRRNFLQSTRERQTHNSNPRCTNKENTLPAWLCCRSPVLMSSSGWSKEATILSWDGPISQATRYSESHTFQSLFTDSETFCRSSALWDFCAASREKQHYVITKWVAFYSYYILHPYIYITDYCSHSISTWRYCLIAGPFQNTQYTDRYLLPCHTPGLKRPDCSA